MIIGIDTIQSEIVILLNTRCLKDFNVKLTVLLICSTMFFDCSVIENLIGQTIKDCKKQRNVLHIF